MCVCVCKCVCVLGGGGRWVGECAGMEVGREGVEEKEWKTLNR